MNFKLTYNLVPRASFPFTSGRKTRALGASISGMRHRYHRYRPRTAQWNRICRIRLFPLLFQNGCSQSSRFPTACQGGRSSGNEIGWLIADFYWWTIFVYGLMSNFNPVIPMSGYKRICLCCILKNKCSLTDHWTVVCSATWPLNGSEAFDTDLTAFVV